MRPSSLFFVLLTFQIYAHVFSTAYGQSLGGSTISSFDVYYPGYTIQDSLSYKASQRAWRGERVYFQLLIWGVGSDALADLVAPLFEGADDSIVANLYFPRAVQADSQSRSCGGYSSRDGFVSLHDALDNKPAVDLGINDTIAIWVSIDIPSEIDEGIYNAHFELLHTSQSITFELELEVLPLELPQRTDWAFHLDLWQFPQRGITIYNQQHPGSLVDLWSDQHFEMIESSYQLLADAGQKVITTHIKDGALGQQGMIRWIRGEDDSWRYDFTAFDRYVETLMALGIKDQISCFSPVGWNKDVLPYHDETTRSQQVLTLPLGSNGYDQRWGHFLTVFEEHLKNKGWFDKTVLYLDEVSSEELGHVVDLIKAVNTQWKLGIAYTHELDPALQQALYDASGIIEVARTDAASSEGINTFYTSCTQRFPNNYLTLENSTAEMTWMGYYTAVEGFDGYLRWAFDNWTKTNPFDLRDGAHTSGDFSFIYRSSNLLDMDFLGSIRLSMLRDGIEEYEKIRQLKSSFAGSEDPFDIQALVEIEELLADFSLQQLDYEGAVKRTKERLTAIAMGKVPYCRVYSLDTPSSLYFDEMNASSDTSEVRFVQSSFPERGYAIIDDKHLSVLGGDSIVVELKPASQDSLLINVWADWNLDQTFSIDELVYSERVQGVGVPVQTSIDIPVGLAPGSGRIRVQITETDAEVQNCGFASGSFLDIPMYVRDVYCTPVGVHDADLKSASLSLHTCLDSLTVKNQGHGGNYFFDPGRQIRVGQSNLIRVSKRDATPSGSSQTLVVWVDTNNDHVLSPEEMLYNMDDIPGNSDQAFVLPELLDQGQYRMRMGWFDGDDPAPCAFEGAVMYDFDIAVEETSEGCAPELLSPYRGSLDQGANMFQWHPNGAGVESWSLILSSVDLVSGDLVTHFEQTFSSSEIETVVQQLPEDGRRLEATLVAVVNGNKIVQTYDYYAHDQYCTPAGGPYEEYYLTSLQTSGAEKDIVYSSANYPENGHELHQDQILKLRPGGSASLLYGLSGSSSCSRVVAWIDWSADGVFDSAEVIGEAGTSQSCANPVSGRLEFEIPVGAQPSTTRLRVRLRDAWLALPGPCSELNFTSAHDFYVLIEEPIVSGSLPPHIGQLSVYPNPGSKEVTIDGLDMDKFTVEIVDGAGALQYSKSFTDHTTSKLTLSTEDLSSGLYFVNVIFQNGERRLFKVLIN